MANFDIAYDTAPQNVFNRPRGPKISDMRTALLTVNSGNSYTDDRLNGMSKNDMVNACALEGLTVEGL